MKDLHEQQDIWICQMACHAMCRNVQLCSAEMGQQGWALLLLVSETTYVLHKL